MWWNLDMHKARPTDFILRIWCGFRMGIRKKKCNSNVETCLAVV
jgi:hypothetical protein